MSTPAKPMYAFARVDKLKTIADLVKAQLHADRDESANCEVRRGTSPDKDQIRWTRGAGGGVFDLIAGWRQAKGSARERTRAPICMHLILGVSPEWVQLAGGLHDQVNPRNLSLLRAAHDFVEAQVGRVAATRLDLDEMGGGVVDVFCVPVFERQRRLRKDGTRSGETVTEISCNKTFDALRAATGESRDYAALQTAWARHAQSHLDPALLRGERKSKTGRRHLETPAYKALMAETEALEERAATAKVVLDQLEVEKKALEQTKRSIEWREAGVARHEREYRNEIDREVKALAAAWKKCASGLELTDADQAAMGASIAIEASTVLGASIEAVKAEKAAQEKRAEELLREEQRAAQLRHKAEDRQRDLDRRQAKIDSDNDAIQTRDAESRERATMLDRREGRLRVAEEEVSAAQELAALREDEAKRLMSRIMAAFPAMMRLWKRASKQGDEEILNHPDVARLAESGNLILEEIENQRRGLESMRQKVEAEIEQMHAQSQERSKQRSELQTLKADLDERDAEITRKTSKLDARDAKITERETTHTVAVAKHESRIAADIDRIRRFVLALRQRLIGAPIAGDQATLADPMFRNIYEQADATRKALDADIASKRKTRDEMVAEREALERQSAKIKAIGPALAAWTEGERSDELKATLGQPEAKPYVDAFNSVWRSIFARRRAVAEQELELRAKTEELEKNATEAAGRLAETEKRASNLAELIEANMAEATRIGKALQRYGKAIDELAAYQNRTSPLPLVEKVVADANHLGPTAQQLRKPPVRGGFERD